MSEIMEGVDLSGLNMNHNPDIDPAKCELAPGVLLLHRPPAPNEETPAGIILPVNRETGEGAFKYHLNCARVVGKGEGCKCKLGHYAFWAGKTKLDDHANERPQPLIPQYTNKDPHLWTIPEKCCIYFAPHGGDPEWVEFAEGGADTVQALDVHGDWTEMSANWLHEGSMFKDADGRTWRALSATKKDGDGNLTSILAAPIAQRNDG